jgi:hypothetical protein
LKIGGLFEDEEGRQWEERYDNPNEAQQVMATENSSKEKYNRNLEK